MLVAAVARSASASQFARQLGSAAHPVVRRPIGADVGGDHLQAGVGVADEGKGKVLGRVEELRVEANNSLAVILKQSPGAGCEILQARPRREDYVRLLRQNIGGRAAVNTDRAHVERMIRRQGGLASLRLGDGNAMSLGEVPQRFGGAGIEHAAAGDDQRLAGMAKLRDRCIKFVL